MRQGKARLFGISGFFLSAAAAFAQFHEFTQNDMRVQRLGMSGDPAPGMPAGVTLTEVSNSTGLRPYGGIAFTGLLRGPGVVEGVNDLVIYGVQGSHLVPIVRTGDPAPGLTPPGVFNGFLGAWDANAAGDVLFGYGPQNSSWVHRNGLELLERPGQAAPGTDGLVFKSMGFFTTLSESRHVAFTAAIGSPNDSSQSFGVWTDRSGTLRKVYDQNDPAPGALSNLRLGTPELRGFSSDDRVVLTTRLSGPGVTTANNHALFVERNGQLTLIAREGDQAPGLAPGVTIAGTNGLDEVRATADGFVSIRDRLSGPGVTADNETAIWSEASGQLRLIARAGDAAPQAGEGVVFGGAENVAPAFNTQGQTVFKSALRGPGTLGLGTESLWLDDDGSKTLLARIGQHAPGFAPDTHFVSFDGWEFGINKPGDITFEGQVYGTDALRSPLALWFIHDNKPQLFLQQDGYFDGQLVSGFSSFAPNDLGQVLLFVVFAGPDGIQDTMDDTTAYYLVNIPEPATLLLLGLGATVFARRRVSRLRNA